MQYKRMEYFRHTFGTPLDAQFRIIVTEVPGKKSGLGDCTLVDLSTGGARILSEFNIPMQRELVQIELEFILNEEKINVASTVVWKKPFEGKYAYGLEFEEGVAKETLIINELKMFRKSEIEKTKKE